MLSKTWTTLLAVLSIAMTAPRMAAAQTAADQSLASHQASGWGWWWLWTVLIIILFAFIISVAGGWWRNHRRPPA